MFCSIFPATPLASHMGITSKKIDGIFNVTERVLSHLSFSHLTEVNLFVRLILGEICYNFINCTRGASQASKNLPELIYYFSR